MVLNWAGKEWKAEKICNPKDTIERLNISCTASFNTERWERKGLKYFGRLLSLFVYVTTHSITAPGATYSIILN